MFRTSRRAWTTTTAVCALKREALAGVPLRAAAAAAAFSSRGFATACCPILAASAMASVRHVRHVGESLPLSEVACAFQVEADECVMASSIHLCTSAPEKG